MVRTGAAPPIDMPLRDRRKGSAPLLESCLSILYNYAKGFLANRPEKLLYLGIYAEKEQIPAKCT